MVAASPTNPVPDAGTIWSDGSRRHPRPTIPRYERADEGQHPLVLFDSSTWATVSGPVVSSDRVREPPASALRSASRSASASLPDAVCHCSG
jgi:hypothetical protein